MNIMTVLISTDQAEFILKGQDEKILKSTEVYFVHTVSKPTELDVI